MTVDEYKQTEEGANAITALIIFILLLTLTIVHGCKMYSDFFTVERKVLDYRRSKPKTTREYKRMSYLTFVAVLFFLLIVIPEVIQYNFTTGNCKAMLVAQLLDKIGYFGSKCTLYLIFILRLHDVYGKSAYGYNAKRLKCIAVTIIIVCIALLCLTQASVFSFPAYTDDTDGSWPYFCQILPQEPYIFYVAAPSALFDFILCIGAMIAFVIPLNKVVKAAEAYNDESPERGRKVTNKRFQKMIYTGYKYKVLVMVSAFSTLLWLVLLMGGLNGIATVLAIIDFFVNPLCLVLMTPYYPSDRYYERLCIVCICCCDPRRNSYYSHATDKHQELQEQDIDSTVAKTEQETTTQTGTNYGVSVDTDMALKTKLPSDYNNYDKNVENNLASVQEHNVTIELTPAPQEPADADADYARFVAELNPKNFKISNIKNNPAILY